MSGWFKESLDEWSAWFDRHPKINRWCMATPRRAKVTGRAILAQIILWRVIGIGGAIALLITWAYVLFG